MIRVVNYRGGCHGEFLVNLVQRHHHNVYWNNIEGDSNYKPGLSYRENNRFNAYKTKEPALNHEWESDKVLEDFYNYKCEGYKSQLFVARTHHGKNIECRYPMLNFYAADDYWHYRSQLCVIYKQYKTYFQKNNVERNIREDEYFTINLPIGDFFEKKSSAISIFELFFDIEWTPAIEKDVDIYFNKDNENLNRYFPGWQKNIRHHRIEKLVSNFYKSEQ